MRQCATSQWCLAHNKSRPSFIHTQVLGDMVGVVQSLDAEMCRRLRSQGDASVRAST